MLSAQRGSKACYTRLLTELMPVIDDFVETRFRIFGQTIEITEECLRTLHKARMSYDSARPFCSWFFAIIRYGMISYLNRNHLGLVRDRMFSYLDRHYPDLIQVESSEDTVGTKGSEDASVNRSAADTPNQFLRSAFAHLPRHYIEAMRLTRFSTESRESTVKAARQLGLTESAIKLRCDRGMKLLRRKMEKMLREGR